MTISSEESPRIQYAGPISAGTTLSFPYSYIDKSQVKAQISDEDVWALDVDYSVGDESVTTISAVASGETLTLYRRTVLDQQASFPQNAKFNSEKINDALDKLTMQQQEQQEALGRSVKFSLDIDTSITDVTVPAPVAGKTLKWNDSETGLVNSDYDPDEAIAITTAAAEDAAEDAAAAQVSATSAAGSAATATTKASEAAVSASNAATSEANALSYRNTAQTSASNAATSETNALSYRNTAQTAATTATTKASEASASAATATTKASEAQTSASNAATSETNADSSADRAEAAASALEGIIPTAADEGKFLRAKTPYTAGVEYAEVQGGVVTFSSLGAVSTNITLEENKITTAAFTGTPTVTLPTVTDTAKQVACVLDFTSSSTGYPIINKVKNLTGTVAVTNGSATVTGTGTAFTTELQVGDTLVIASVEYKVSAIASNTSLTLTTTYAGTTVSGLTIGRKILRWSKNNQGNPPSAYSILAGVRNKIEFKTIWENGLLYWETEYDTYGGVEATFVQPVLSANGTLGGSSFAVLAGSEYSGYPIYKAFNGNNSDYWQSNTWAADTIKIYNPIPLKVSQFNIININNQYNMPILSGNVYASSDNSTYTFLTSFTNSYTSANASWNIDIPLANRGFYKYYRLDLNHNPSNYGNIQDVALIATQIS